MNFPYYIFAWIASLAYASEVILGKLISKHSIANPWLYNFFWSLFILLFTIPFAVAHGVSLPSHWPNLIIASVLGAVAGLCFVLILYLFDASVLAPLYNFKAAFTVLLGVMLLNEVLSLRQVVLIILIFVMGIFVTVDERWSAKSFFNKSMIVAMIGMVASSFMALFVKKTIGEIGYWDTTLGIAVLEQVVLLFTIPMFAKDTRTLNGKQLGGVVLVAALGMIGFLASNRAYETNIGITSVITSLPISMFIAVIFSFVAPEFLEKHTAKVYAVRFFAAAVMIIAALNLT